MKTEKEYKLFIKNQENWLQISESGNVRTCEMVYQGHSAFRMDERNDGGAWKRKHWYRITPAGISVEMKMHEFIEFLKLIDRQEEKA